MQMSLLWEAIQNNIQLSVEKKKKKDLKKKMKRRERELAGLGDCKSPKKRFGKRVGHKLPLQVHLVDAVFQSSRICLTFGTPVRKYPEYVN